MINFKSSFLRFVSSISNKTLGYLSISTFFITLIITILVAFTATTFSLHTFPLSKIIISYLPDLIFLVFLMLIPFGILMLIITLQSLMREGRIKADENK